MGISKLQIPMAQKAAGFGAPSAPASQPRTYGGRNNLLEIEGSVRANLRAAVTSARRLRDRPVYADTLRFWRQLIDRARSEASGSEGECVAELIAELELRLVQHSSFSRQAPGG